MEKSWKINVEKEGAPCLVTGESDKLGTYLLTSGNTWLREVTYGQRPTISWGIITIFMNNDNIMSNTNTSTQ